MQNVISFVVNAVPVAQPRQRHRVIQKKGGKAFAHNYTPKDSPVNDYKKAVRYEGMKAFRIRTNAKPLKGPIVVDFVFVMPRPKSKVWKTKPMPREPHIGKPDRDNLIKSTQDALNGCIWRDDSQIFAGETVKWIAAGDEEPHVEITVTRLEARVTA